MFICSKGPDAHCGRSTFAARGQGGATRRAVLDSLSEVRQTNRFRGTLLRSSRCRFPSITCWALTIRCTTSTPAAITSTYGGDLRQGDRAGGTIIFYCILVKTPFWAHFFLIALGRGVAARWPCGVARTDAAHRIGALMLPVAVFLDFHKLPDRSELAPGGTCCPIVPFAFVFAGPARPALLAVKSAPSGFWKTVFPVCREGGCRQRVSVHTRITWPTSTRWPVVLVARAGTPGPQQHRLGTRV